MADNPRNPRTTPGVKVALSIAGSDSSGGAGIQADLKTFSVMRVYGATAITAITSQNTTGVKHAMVLEPAVIEKQIDAVAGDLQVHATKTGMLANAAIVRAVATAVRRLNLQPLVVDPVMVAKSGDALIDDRAVKILCEQLLPLAAIVTPNRFEAAKILGMTGAIDDPAKAGGAAEKICKTFGVRACIIKGFMKEGASGGDGEAIDIFYDGSSVHEVAAPSRLTKNTHGAGCVFAAAIAAGLALEQPLAQAVAAAKRFISEAIRQTADIGHGRGPVNALAWLDVK